MRHLISLWLSAAAFGGLVTAQRARQGKYASLAMEDVLGKTGQVERAIITYEMPEQDNAALLEQVLEDENAIIVPRKQINSADGTLEVTYGTRAPKVAPFKFGKALPIALNMSHPGDGEWIENPEAGTRLWRFKVHSPGAESISIYFDEFRLNPQAELYVIGQEVREKSSVNFHVLGNIWCFYGRIE